MSWLVSCLFSLANSLILANVLSAMHDCYTNSFSRVSCNKNRLETENIYLQEESIVKNQKW